MNQKLDVGNVLTRTFETYRDQFTLLIPAALILFLGVSLLNGLLLSGTGGLLATLLVVLLGTVATYWFQGMVVEAVRDILDGRRDHTIGSLFQSAVPVIVPLFLVGLLAGIAIAIGFLLLIVPGLFLLTIWAVLAPVVVVERAGVFDAFGRSRQLVKGHGWQVFGVIVILFLITAAASAIVQAIFSSVDSFVGYFVADLIVRVLVSPLSALAAAVMYFELKARHGEPVPGLGAAAPAPAGVTPGGPAPGPAAPGTGTPAPGTGTPAPGPEAPGQPAPGQQPGGAPPGGQPPGTQQPGSGPERPA